MIKLIHFTGQKPQARYLATNQSFYDRYIMAPFKCLVYGATFSCYKLIIIIIIIIIMMMMMIIIIIIIITTMISIMKIIIIIINRSADLKIGNAGINQ